MVVSSAFSSGPHLHSMLDLLSALYLSKRPVKQFTVGAVTTAGERLFHMLTTLLLKNSAITEFYYFALPVSNCDLKLDDSCIVKEI